MTPAHSCSAILRTALDLQQGFDDNFLGSGGFVFHQPDFVILCGLLDIDPKLPAKRTGRV